MRFVIDTNIIFSGVYNLDSNAGKILFLAIEKDIELVAPVYVKEEIIRNLRNKLKFSVDEINEIISALPIIWIEEAIYEDHLIQAQKLISHKKDIPILACALSMGLDMISGDKHFQKIKTDKIRIWKLKKALIELK